MGFFATLKQWLTSSSNSTPRPRHPDLHPIDVKQLAAELKLKDEAARLGSEGIPAADAKALSGPEAQIVQRVETYRQGYLDWAVARMGILSSDLGKLTITAEVNRALQADKEFEREAGRLLNEMDGELRPLSESARNARKELDDFRAQHRLSRDARWPAFGTKMKMGGFLLFAILVEGFLNAYLFSTGLANGLVEGLAYAAILAAMNVATAFMLGNLVRYAFHRNWAIKVFGILVGIAAVCAIALIGLGIAHFRESLMAEAQEPTRVALTALKAGPWALQDGLSWGLALVTWVFGAVALGEGFCWDDRYPGYGALKRHVDDVDANYEAELASLREKLEDLKEEQLSVLDKVAGTAQATMAQYESRIEEKKSAALRLKTALQDAENSMDALLRSFRTENELHRKGLSRPLYFDEKPPLRQLPFPDFSTEADSLALAAQAGLVNSLVADVQAIRGRIQEAFNKQFDLLKPLANQYSLKEGA